MSDLFELSQTVIPKLQENAALPTPFSDMCKDAAKKIRFAQNGDPDTLLQGMHLCQVFEEADAAKVLTDHSFWDDVAKADIKLWADFEKPPVEDHLQGRLADMLFGSGGHNDAHVMITLGDQSRRVGVELIRLCLRRKVDFKLQFMETNIMRLMLRHTDKEGLKALADRYVEESQDLTRRISIGPETPDQKLVDMDHEKNALYGSFLTPVRRRISSGDLDFTLTRIPTRKDTEIDGIPYEDYARLYFEMCDQPWHAIEDAQAHLIAMLDSAKMLRFTNEDGTDLRMSVDGYTFCNSVVARNIPGSEVFSAPDRASVEGTIIAKGKFSHQAGQIIEDLTLTFEQGYLARFEANAGAEHMQEFLDRDPGNRYIGEVGIGTNPHLKRHILNGLLVEKIGGSFHVALGASYMMDQYGGREVRVDNGNRSQDHWDITTMLFGKKGMIDMDGVPLMVDGIFLSEELDVLNRGWAAIPEKQRPDYWLKERKAFGIDD